MVIAHVGVADFVQELRLPGVDVAEDAHDRRAEVVLLIRRLLLARLLLRLFRL